MRFLHFLTGLVHSHKRWLFFVWSTIVVWFLWSDVGFAADEDKFVKGLNQVLSWVSVMLGIISSFIGALLHPNWTDGTIVGLNGSDGVLKKMWILVSNVVYFVFALIFVGIAFLTIYRGESFALKDKLPRFIAGILIVPFSWFIVQFVISISSLLTFAILALPFDTFDDLDLAKKNTEIMCDVYTIDVTPKSKTPFSPQNLNDCKGKKITLAQVLDPDNSEGLFGIMSVYTFGVMKIDKVALLFTDGLGNGIKEIGDISATLLFDILFIIVYMLILLALFLALFVRGVYMWGYAMLSPVFGLLLFFGKEKENKDSSFGILPFINLALIPVYVGAALSFGLVFLLVAGKDNTINTQSEQSILKNDILTLRKPTGTQKTNDEEKDPYHQQTTNGTFTLLPNSKTPVSMHVIGAGGTLISDKDPSTTRGFEGFAGIFGTILLRLFGLAILYMTVMLALKSSKVTASIAEPFESFGKSIGQMLAKAPINTPMIPTGTKHGNISIAGLTGFGKSFADTMTNNENTKWSGLGSQIASSLLGVSEEIKQLREIQHRRYSSPEDRADGVNDLARSTSATRIQQDASVRNEVSLALDKLGFSDADKKAVLAAQDDRALAQALHKGGRNAGIATRTFTQANLEGLVGTKIPQGPGASKPPSGSTPTGTQKPILLAGLQGSGNTYTYRKTDGTQGSVSKPTISFPITDAEYTSIGAELGKLGYTQANFVAHQSNIQDILTDWYGSDPTTKRPNVTAINISTKLPS